MRENGDIAKIVYYCNVVQNTQGFCNIDLGKVNLKGESARRILEALKYLDERLIQVEDKPVDTANN